MVFKEFRLQIYQENTHRYHSHNSCGSRLASGVQCTVLAGVLLLQEDFVSLHCVMQWLQHEAGECLNNCVPNDSIVAGEKRKK